MSDERLAGWLNGDPLTLPQTAELGRAKWTHARRSDGKRFMRVDVVTGDRAGQQLWENGQWVLGQGSYDHTCFECTQTFRSDDPKASFCLACLRHQRPAYEADAVSATHARNRLFGTATPYQAPVAEPGPPIAPRKDEDDSPF